MRSWIAAFCLVSAVLPLSSQSPASAPASRGNGRIVGFRDLLREMTDASALSRRPAVPYRSLQASSMNRASVNRNQPDQSASGWFADGDGTGFIRIDETAGKKEWVLMEHEGPGCLTRIWTPFFYYDFGERRGPNVRIYLDGAAEPVIDEPLIALVRGEGSIPEPFAHPTARAGDSYLPIPFARHARVTMTRPPFYYIINYRACAPETSVETFTAKTIAREKAAVAAAAAALGGFDDGDAWTHVSHATVLRDRPLVSALPKGSNAITRLAIEIHGVLENPRALRGIFMTATFDDERTISCPVGDFFASPDDLHTIRTLRRWHDAKDETFRAAWRMPYARSAVFRFENRLAEPLVVDFRAFVESADPNPDLMHFFAVWRPDEIFSGDRFADRRVLAVRGRGVFVADNLTVVNPNGSWWGEGDEKIYVDGAFESGFPTHFGTGTEDYYGWAGGVVPTRADEFSRPFLANVRVGGADGFTRGTNICTRERGLDAIPFDERFVFDMESSFGTDIRNPWNLLATSTVAYFYAAPGAVVEGMNAAAAADTAFPDLLDLTRRSEAMRTKAERGH